MARGFCTASFGFCLCNFRSSNPRTLEPALWMCPCTSTLDVGSRARSVDEALAGVFQLVLVLVVLALVDLLVSDQALPAARLEVACEVATA